MKKNNININTYTLKITRQSIITMTLQYCISWTLELDKTDRNRLTCNKQETRLHRWCTKLTCISLSTRRSQLNHARVCGEAIYAYKTGDITEVTSEFICCHLI